MNRLALPTLLVAGLFHSPVSAGATTAGPLGHWELRGLVVSEHNLYDRSVGTVFHRSLRFRTCGPACRTLSFETISGSFERRTMRRQGRYWIGTSSYKRACRDGSGSNTGRSRLKLRVTRSVTRDGQQLASALTGTFRATYTGDCDAADEAWEVTARRDDLPPAPAPPTADFTVTPDTLSVASNTNTAFFEDESSDDEDSGRIAKRHWDFGDPASGAANTSNQVSPAHAYTTPGAYRVTLTVTDNRGLTASTRRTVVISP